MALLFYGCATGGLSSPANFVLSTHGSFGLRYIAANQHPGRVSALRILNRSHHGYFEMLYEFIKIGEHFIGKGGEKEAGVMCKPTGARLV